MRDHYTLNYDGLALKYAVDNAEWGIELNEEGRIVDQVYCAVVLADGTVYDTEDLESGQTRREELTTPLGNTRAYRIDLETPEDFVIHHTLKQVRGRGFQLIQMAVTNTGSEPLAIDALRPVVMGAESLPGMPPSTEAHTRRLSSRGGFALYDTQMDPQSILFYDRDRDLSVGLGVLPEGMAVSGVDFEQNGSTWQGHIASRFEPARQLAPGETLRADPVWVSFTTASPAGVDHMISWMHAMMNEKWDRPSPPDAWITGPSGASANELYRRVEDWNLSGVNHVLVPAGWPRRPGALEGASPAYPRDMSAVASAIGQRGKSPGITIDPLAATEGESAWAVEMPEGVYWLDLTQAEARRHAANRAAELTDMGFEFFVIKPSSIPNEVLEQFGITRREADSLAFEAVEQGAPDAPVLPSPRTAIDGRLAYWLEAAANGSRMGEYGANVGPVRIHGDQTGGLSQPLLTALDFFAGPIEIAGQPNDEGASLFNELFPRDSNGARPMDAIKRAPRVWEAPMNRLGDSLYGSALITFPGASPWPVQHISLDGGAPVLVWRAEDGAAIQSSGVLPSSDALTVYGATTDQSRPILVGALHNNGRPAANRVDGLEWDESSRTLSGVLTGPGSQDATAYVYVPDAWGLISSSIGGGGSEAQQSENLVRFDVAANSNTRFELTFERRL
ncbi:MAG: hypothetical protein R6W89_08275 [Candidatus Hydrogenedentota bacterium]